MNRILASRWTKIVVFLLCLAPIGALVWWGFQQDLSGNPIEFVTHYTGDWTIRFLMITLSVTPLRVLTKRPAFTRYRRMLGLFAFFYGCLHLVAWILFTPGFGLQAAIADILERPYITIGMTSFLAMLPLAITSTAGWVRRMGFKNWQRLHKLIYASALAGVIHYYWLVKSDVRAPLRYAAIFAVLMLFRIVVWMRESKAAASKLKRPQPVVPQP